MCDSGSNSTNYYAILNFNHKSSATELNRASATNITSDAHINLWAEGFILQYTWGKEYDFSYRK